ncbi:hypothetical protein PFFVO_02746 [Plasmodium falciparum Vietnam Oak-Knoll (FVO)]|uniref:Uncharacterized protein n=1 Tax=Plasmodium falciparum Vietnam Oak-Knoll (FVO) TaxID=1036723 RepID=A0A024V7S4_PLAFA|nr:hypothetical protein PFFVO_02746 [Plasmodium falciparum Vietnam Oak-Knoll (FVO)]
MKVQNNIIKEDPFSVSHIIGDRLLQGWTLLNSTCHMCNITPLIKQKNKEDRYCARCDLFIKIRETSHEKEEKRNDILNEEITKDEKKDNDKDLLNEKENESSLNNDSLMYIKEIKLQNEEFNNILNKNNICTKDLVGDLLEYKNYIKDRCGYNVAEWLNMQTVKTNQTNQTNQKEEDILNYIKNKTNEQMNTCKHTNNLDEEYIYNVHSKDLHRKYFKNMYQNNQDEKHEDNYINVLQHVRRDLKISEENYFCPSKLHSNKYNKLETEFFILNKTKNVLMDKLEKFTDKLSKNDNKNEELENISHLVTIVTILEKINNLKKYVMV